MKQRCDCDQLALAMTWHGVPRAPGEPHGLFRCGNDVLRGRGGNDVLSAVTAAIGSSVARACDRLFGDAGRDELSGDNGEMR